MTRGKIIFIEKNLRVYSTIEFNGDMYPYDGGHGEEIVGLFQRRGFSDFRSYEHYVKKFDDKNFGYFPAYGMELIQFKGTYREDIFDFTDNYTDYLYLINRSGRDVCVKLEDGKKTIPDAALAIINFQSLREIVHGNDIDETGVPDGHELAELMKNMNWDLFIRQDLYERLDEAIEEAKEGKSYSYEEAFGQLWQKMLEHCADEDEKQHMILKKEYEDKVEEIEHRYTNRILEDNHRKLIALVREEYAARV